MLLKTFKFLLIFNRNTAISELCRGKTLIVIAHRLNTIRNVSRILVIKEGQIVESGTHNELMAKGGQYKNMVDR